MSATSQEGPHIVGTGYDEIAETYRSYRIAGFAEDERAFLERVRSMVPRGGEILELGCGAGEPITAFLAERGRITGVDLSARQLALARASVPAGRFVLADMAEIEFRPATFDAVAAFASVIHVPRESHPALFRRIASWLSPGGIFAGELGRGDNPDQFERDWMGAPMYWSHFDADHTLELIRIAGFEIEESSVIRGREHDGTTNDWLGVIARRTDELT